MGFTPSRKTCGADEVSPKMFEGELSKPSFHGMNEDSASNHQLSATLLNRSSYLDYALTDSCCHSMDHISILDSQNKHQCVNRYNSVSSFITGKHHIIHRCTSHSHLDHRK